MVPSSNLKSCRICFDQDCGFVSIFQSINEEKITNMLKDLTGELVLMDQQVSNYICTDCCNALTIAHKLRQQFIQAEIYFKNQVVNNMNNKADTNEDIQTDVVDGQHPKTDNIQPKVVHLELRNGFVRRAIESPPEAKNIPNAEDMINSLDSCENVEIVFTEREEAYALRMKVLNNPLPVNQIITPNPIRPIPKCPNLEIDPADLERSCCMCKSIFATTEELLEHVNTHPQRQNSLDRLRAMGQDLDEPFRKRCALCYRSFAQISNYNKHRRLQYLLKTVICEQCGEAFPSTKPLHAHMLKEHAGDVRMIPCSICSKLFKETYILVHERKHTVKNDRRGSFPCKICNKVFAKKHYLASHTRSHQQIKLHACHLCPKTFNSVQKLQVHMNVHENKRNFACDYCDKTFIHMSDRNRHVKVHTGERPHVCQICKQGFIKKYCLTKHMEKSHPGAKPYKCDYCSEAFLHKSEIEQHMMFVHK